MLEHASRQPVAIVIELLSRGLQVAVEINEGSFSFEDFPLLDSYFSESWPQLPPIGIALQPMSRNAFRH